MKGMKKVLAIVGIALHLITAQAYAQQPQDQPKTQSVQKRLQSINKTTGREIQRVRGIGPKKAEVVMDYLKEHGPVDNMRQLLDIPGIGPKTLQNIKEHYQAD